MCVNILNVFFITMYSQKGEHSGNLGCNGTCHNFCLPCRLPWDGYLANVLHLCRDNGSTPLSGHCVHFNITAVQSKIHFHHVDAEGHTGAAGSKSSFPEN